MLAQTDSTSLQATKKTNYKGYEISGVVRDIEDKQPIPYATISFPNSSVGTSTDDDGNYILQFTTIPSDSITVQVIGYKTTAVAIDKNVKTSVLNINLERSSAYLEEVIIRPGEDPAIELMRYVLAAKPKNNPDQVAYNYKYESYNKVEVDLLNFNRKKFERLPVPYLKQLGFIFDNMDSSSYTKPYLPVYLTEALSDYYYQKQPKKSKEVVKATQMKVIKNKNMTNSMSQYLGKLYLAINPYDNYLPFFDKEFVSPLSNSALTFYKYKIEDTQQVSGYNVITLSFTPQRKGENCFAGTIRIVDSIYAIQYIEADMPTSANVNWVKNANFYKEYTPLGDSIWFCTKENITAEMQLTDQVVQTIGFLVKKTTSYDDIVINDPQISDTLESKIFKRDVIVSDSTTKNDDPEFWAKNRHEALSEQESGIYQMYDSLENNKSYQRLKTLGKIFASGGYKFGPIELGPYWQAYSNNQIEGNRFQFSMGTTPKLFKNIYMNGYVAYGVGDDRFKYNISSRFILNRSPRRYFNFSYTRDIDYTVNYYDKVGINNIFSVAIRKNDIPLKFMFADDVRFEFYNEFYSGFSQQITFYRKIYDPYDPLPSTAIFRTSEGVASPTVTTSEVNLLLRFAYKEKFLNGNYLRYSLGSKYPIVEMRLALGLKDVFNSDYDYQRINITVSDNWRIPPFGQLYFNLFAGKYFGTLPYPLLEQHPGNETYYYNKYAFNMMNQYEFISDQYVGVNMEHNLGGGLLKYIPLLKRLKWRQFYNAKGLIGSLNADNMSLNFNKGFTFRTLNNTPYLEVGTGIENIFKVLRVDFVWRVTPQSLPNEPVKRDFGILGSMKFAF